MGAAVHNPLFARAYHWTCRYAEEAGQGEHRDELLAGLSGRVLEIGAGNGVSFNHYPSTVAELVAVEPEDYLRERARRAAASAPIPTVVVEAVAGALPFATGTFDAAVTSLVLCSVPRQDQALVELARVIRPGGELRFYEHVLARNKRLARVQRAVTAAGLWPRLGGGCHADRSTGSAIEDAGFEIERCRRFSMRDHLLTAPVAPRILGIARRP